VWHPVSADFSAAAILNVEARQFGFVVSDFAEVVA
jgi:hypothetical protein